MPRFPPVTRTDLLNATSFLDARAVLDRSGYRRVAGRRILGSVDLATYGGGMAREPEAVRITTATRSRGQDIARRQKRYLISMGIRTGCFLLAIFSMGHWWLWLFVGASFFLPTIAVVVANTHSTMDPGGPELFDPGMSHRALGGPSRS
jgi:hypothetical protein